MKKSCSFAGSANGNIPDLGVTPKDAESTRTPEDAAAFGAKGSESLLPEGTEVELLPGGKYKVVATPKQ